MNQNKKISTKIIIMIPVFILYNIKLKKSDKIEKIFSNILTNREILLKYLLVQLSKKYLTVDAQYTTGGRLGFRLCLVL